MGVFNSWCEKYSSDASDDAKAGMGCVGLALREDWRIKQLKARLQKEIANPTPEVHDGLCTGGNTRKAVYAAEDRLDSLTKSFTKDDQVEYSHKRTIRDGKALRPTKFLLAQWRQRR